MKTENIIGKQVYTTIPHKEMWDIKFDTTKVWTIVDIIPSGETNDWYDRIVIKDEDFNKREVPEYEVVVVPDYGLPEDEMIYHYLLDNGVYSEVWTSDDDVEVSIEWGDWKHEHLFAKSLMEYINYLELNSKVTAENDGDAYSAIHTFHKFPAALVKFRQDYINTKIREEVK